MSIVSRAALRLESSTAGILGGLATTSIVGNCERKIGAGLARQMRVAVRCRTATAAFGIVAGIAARLSKLQVAADISST